MDMNTVTYLHPATAAKATAVRANLSLCGVKGARVRVMPNGALRLVISDRSQRDAARDALVLSDACTGAGVSFAVPSSESAWNGPVEIFVRFTTA